MAAMARRPIPVIDIARDTAPAEIRRACLDTGFFYASGHGVSSELRSRLVTESRAFFALPLDEKLAIRMERGGRAWRGYFPVGAELTSGRPDQKEGLYFGAELDTDHPKALAGTPLHGRNLFPERPAGLARAVLDYLDAMTALGHRLMELVAASLDLAPSYFATHYTDDPLVLFRIFNYPALVPAEPAQWSVAEHTDYGLLTMLLQDDRGGLQVRTKDGWIDADPVENTFVCNIGDMLDRMTGGLYRSTPHRVRNESGHDRLSFPFFFDPNWDADVRPIESTGRDDAADRWDRTSVHTFEGTYGDYLWQKVARVFPDLQRDVR